MLTRNSESKAMSPTVDEIVAMESQIWEALRTGDPELDAKFLTEDFLGVYTAHT